MSHSTELHSNCKQLRALVTMARELLQIDEPGTALRLAGRAIIDLAGTNQAMVLIGGERPFCVAFERDGPVKTVDSSHPWYATAHQRMTAGPGVAHPRSTVMVAVPQAHPVAVLVVASAMECALEICEHQLTTLEIALEFTAAILGRIQVRSALEQLVTTQYSALAEQVQEHADELARRDLAACDMLSLSLTDVLTGLNNRRGFFARAEPLYRLALRQQHGSMVVYADIDGLKAVNDTLGHAAGDQMIRDAAAVLSESLRNADILARMGGDEFVAYAMADAQPQALLARLEQALHAFNHLQQRPYQLSLSVGMVSCDAAGSMSLNDYIQQADCAMYQHKRRRPHLGD